MSSGGGDAVWVVTELGEHPGGEDGAESGLAEVDLSVPVPAKMLAHHLAEFADLAVELADQAHGVGDDDGVGGLHRRRLPQLRCAEDLLSVPCSSLDVLAPRASERRGDLGLGQACCPSGSGARASSSSTSGASRSSKASNAAGKKSRSAA